jgi:hypothetical protein
MTMTVLEVRSKMDELFPIKQINICGECSGLASSAPSYHYLLFLFLLLLMLLKLMISQFYTGNYI